MFPGIGGEVTEGGVLMAKLLVKIYDCTYEDGVLELCKSSEPEKAFVDLNNVTVLPGALTKDIREVLRTLHACEHVISSSAAGSPTKASLRGLVKHTSDAGGEDTHVVAQEREDIWRKAVAHRKTDIFGIRLVKKQRSNRGGAEERYGQQR